jgi:hypothetical protein
VLQEAKGEQCANAHPPLGAVVSQNRIKRTSDWAGKAAGD